MNPAINVLLVLSILLRLSSGSGGDGDNGVVDELLSIQSNAVDDDPLHHAEDVGGLRWQDLGVSLEPCPLTTDRMIQKYEDLHDGRRTSEKNEADDGHCLDESEWLLHPSSGFVENGSLCGIIGPVIIEYHALFPYQEKSFHFLKMSRVPTLQLFALPSTFAVFILHLKSGAGKSTFLNALGGTTPRGSGVYLTGSVWYEECPPPPSSSSATTTGCHRRRLSRREGDIALISQHDNFFDMLTPRESLEFAAYLELQKQQQSKQRDIIADVGGGDDDDDDDDERERNPDHKEIAKRKLASLGLLGVADRRIGDRTKLDSGGGGSSRRIGWGRIRSKVRSSGGGGGLSGGERRRLSVALELITEPKIFLADEPTTGLDSSQAGKVVKLISTLAKQRNVPSICTLHQPKSSIWRTLDQCIVLAPGGKMCYAGDRKNATTYFASIGYECPRDTNPAEFFIDLVTIDTDDPVQATADKARIDVLHHRFLESCMTGNMTPLPASNGIQTIEPVTGIRSKLRGISDSIHRFGALLLRSWRQNIRNRRILCLRLGASVVQAGLFAAIFPSVRDDKSLAKSIADRVALLTFGVINMSIMALMKALDLFAKERSVVLREHMRSNYYCIEYLLAKAFAEIPADSFFALVFATALKRLTGLRTSMMTLVKTYCLVTVSSVSLGFAIGSIASSVESAMSLGVPIMVIFMIVGVINPSGVDSDEHPNRVLKYLKLASPIKWAIEALVTAEFRGMSFGEEDRGRWGQLKDLPKMGALAMVKDGDNVLKNLGLGAAKYSDLMENLAILSSVYLLMSWLGLSYLGPSFIETENM